LEIARHRANELTSINSYLESIISGIHRGVAILGSGDKVLVWNKEVEDMWGLRPDAVLGTSSSS
jgi:two-component system, chemotaxis family, CheB/CheR fusion protein